MCLVYGSRYYWYPPPSPAESNGCPLNFVVNVFRLQFFQDFLGIFLGCFAWRTGWICLKWFSCLIFIVDQNKEAMLVKQHFFINNVDWEVHRLGMRECVKTRIDNCLWIWIFSQKLPFSVEKKMFQRQI